LKGSVLVLQPGLHGTCASAQGMLHRKLAV